MRKCENNAIIIFFISLFILSSFCIWKIHNKSNKNNLPVNSENNTISNTNNDKKISTNRRKKNQKILKITINLVN
ncbi:hypothetical protein Z969_06260 [Clostridium novyi A str. 4570]|uniref:Uncharacterized protein n=1 Tax=Clostridium novyi A str. 4570 TaxID=1444290 RepID=A0AA89CMJ1_CLONO|nr:hypothetical protein [Clostridium novyi]KGN02240.1 hypothetical protein Z969_06260 [Clostridium novyi A str. 4570]